MAPKAWRIMFVDRRGIPGLRHDLLFSGDVFPRYGLVESLDVRPAETAGAAALDQLVENRVARIRRAGEELEQVPHSSRSASTLVARSSAICPRRAGSRLASRS